MSISVKQRIYEHISIKRLHIVDLLSYTYKFNGDIKNSLDAEHGASLSCTVKLCHSQSRDIGSTGEFLGLLEGILAEQTDNDEMYASELKGVLLRLRPDFNEKSFGCATFLNLLETRKWEQP